MFFLYLSPFIYTKLLMLGVINKTSTLKSYIYSNLFSVVQLVYFILLTDYLIFYDPVLLEYLKHFEFIFIFIFFYSFPVCF